MEGVNNITNGDNVNIIPQMGFHKNLSGQRCLRRLRGSIMLGIGICLAIILFIYSIFHKSEDANIALNIVNLLLISDSSLVGVSVMEDIRKKA